MVKEGDNKNKSGPCIIIQQLRSAQSQAKFTFDS